MPIFIPPAPPGPAATGPDVSAGEEAFERIMDDGVTLTRDVAGTADAILDNGTGQLVQAARQLIYAGKAMITGQGGGSTSERSGQYIVPSSPTLYLPLSYMRANPGAEPARGDYVTVTSSRRDPAMVGRVYEVVDLSGGTIIVSRKCTLVFRG